VVIKEKIEPSEAIKEKTVSELNEEEERRKQCRKLHIITRATLVIPWSGRQWEWAIGRRSIVFGSFT
jgi:hypothetical protein